MPGAAGKIDDKRTCNIRSVRIQTKQAESLKTVPMHAEHRMVPTMGDKAKKGTCTHKHKEKELSLQCFR